MGTWQAGALRQKKNVFIWLQHLIFEGQELERGPWVRKQPYPTPSGRGTASSDTSWASETQGCLTHLCQFFDSGRVGAEAVQGVSGRSVKGTRAPSWLQNTAGPFLPSKPRIPSTVPGLAEYSRLAATTCEEFSDYSSTLAISSFS